MEEEKDSVLHCLWMMMRRKRDRKGVGREGTAEEKGDELRRKMRGRGEWRRAKGDKFYAVCG